MYNILWFSTMWCGMSVEKGSTRSSFAPHKGVPSTWRDNWWSIYNLNLVWVCLLVISYKSAYVPGVFLRNYTSVIAGSLDSNVHNMLKAIINPCVWSLSLFSSSGESDYYSTNSSSDCCHDIRKLRSTTNVSDLRTPRLRCPHPGRHLHL